MKISITNNCVVQGSRRTPLIDVKGNTVVIDNAFITDASYAKYLVPVIKLVDKFKKIF